MMNWVSAHTYYLLGDFKMLQYYFAHDLKLRKPQYNCEALYDSNYSNGAYFCHHPISRSSVVVVVVW